MLFIFIIHTILLLLISLILDSFSICICGWIGLLLIALSIRKLNRNEINIVVICSFIAILTCVGIYYGSIAKFGHPYWGGAIDGDERMFENAASQMIQIEKYDLFSIIDKNTYIRGLNNAKLFVWIMTLFIRVANIFGGYHVLCLRFFNIYLMISASVIFYKASNKRCGKNYLLLLLLFPNILYLCSFGFREVFVYYCLSWCSFFTTGIENEDSAIKKKKNIVLLLPILFCLYWLRTESIFWGLSIIVINLFFSKEENLSTKKKILFILFIAIMLAMASAIGLLSYAENLADHYTEYRMSFNTGLSLKILSASLFPFGWILRILYAFANPFPIALLNPFSYINNFYDIMILLTHIGTIWQLFQLYYIYLGIKRWNRSAFIMICIISSIALTSFTFRHFLFVYPFMFETILYNKTAVSKQKVNNIRIVTAFGIFTLGLLYLVLK